MAGESSHAPDSAEALRLARRIVDLASDKQASDIVLLDIRGVSLIADYFVICTAGSERQASAILKDLSERLLEELISLGCSIERRQGFRLSGIGHHRAAEVNILSGDRECGVEHAQSHACVSALRQSISSER